MKILQYSNWKQKIAFNNIVYKDVKRYSLTLNTMEREIMETEINFYRTHFSLIQVIKHFKTLKKAKDIEIFIKAVLKRSENILYILRVCLRLLLFCVLRQCRSCMHQLRCFGYRLQK